MKKKEKILIIGMSSISLRHMMILRKKGYKEIYFISKHGLVSKFYKLICLENAKKKFFDFIFICCPANERIYYLKNLKNNGKKFFLEKPISDKMTNLKKMNFSPYFQKKIYVGYVLRHNPLVKSLLSFCKLRSNGKFIGAQFISRSYLPNWRKHIEFKKSVSASRNKGGGVLLELSHELDLIKYLFGNFEIKFSKLTNLRSLNIDVEERADLILLDKKSVPINLLLDFSSKKEERIITINFQKNVYQLDFLKQTLEKNNGVKNSIIKLTNTKNKMFEKQIDYFLKTVNFKNSYEDAVYTLNKISHIR